MGLRATSLGNVRRPPYDGCDTHRIRISGEAIRGFGRLNGLWAKGSDASALKTVCTKRHQCRILDGTFVQPIRLNNASRRSPAKRSLPLCTPPRQRRIFLKANDSMGGMQRDTMIIIAVAVTAALALAVVGISWAMHTPYEPNWGMLGSKQPAFT